MKKFKKYFIRKWTLYLAYSFSAFISCSLAFMLALNFSVPAASSSGSGEATEGAVTEGGATEGATGEATGGALKATAATKKTSSTRPPVSKIMKDIIKNVKLIVSQGFSAKKKTHSSIEDEVAAETFKPSATATPSNEEQSFSDSKEVSDPVASSPQPLPVDDTEFANGEQAFEPPPPQGGDAQAADDNFVPVPESESGLASAPVAGVEEGVAEGVGDASLPSSSANDPSLAAVAIEGESRGTLEERALASPQGVNTGLEGTGNNAVSPPPSGEMMATDPSMDPSVVEGAGGLNSPSVNSAGGVDHAGVDHTGVDHAGADATGNYAEGAYAEGAYAEADSRNPAAASMPNSAEGMDSAVGEADSEEPASGALSATSAEVQSYMAPWIYSFGDQKDPFEDPTRREIASIEPGEERIVIPQTPPEKYDLKDIILRGIIWDSRRPKALFELPGQEGGYYTLLKGDKIGQHGIIFDIRESEVVVVETHWSGSGEQATEEQTVKIKKINRVTASK